MGRRSAKWDTKMKHADGSGVGSEHGKEENGLLTAAEVAKILNIHINTVRNWSNIGVLKSLRVGPRRDRRFKKEDIDRFLYK